LLCLIGGQPAHGETFTYRYTGTPFTEVSPPYTTSHFISGTVTFEAPSNPGLRLSAATYGPSAEIPLSAVTFSFTDGVQTITNRDIFEQSDTPSTIVLRTDPEGNVVEWGVELNATEFVAKSIRTRRSGSLWPSV
jgi:hypothetical protein